MFEKLFVEIKNVAVRVAFAENGNETENVALKLKTFAVGRNHAFAGNLGRSVERGLHGKRRVFGRGNFFRLAINAAGGTESNALDAIGAHGFEDIESGDGILLQILRRMFEAKAGVGIRGEMKNGVATGHRLGERRQIEVVAFDELEVGIFQRAFQKFFLAGGKIIPADNLPAVGEQTVNEVAADEPRRARDKNLVH